MRPRWQVLSYYVLIVLLGALLDFFLAGICKIIWFVFYAPTFLVAAHSLFVRLDKSAWQIHAKRGAILFAATAFACHFLAIGHQRLLVYPLNLASTSPLTLDSPDWPQILIVESEALLQYLKAHPQQTRQIPAVILETTNYGCVQSARIQTVAGVDLQNDPVARWTWKTAPAIVKTPPRGPGSEDRNFPWCRLPVFYAPFT